jgi:hypothetical protein
MAPKRIASGELPAMAEEAYDSPPRPHCIRAQGTPVCVKCERIRDASSKYLSISGEGHAGLPHGIVAQKLWIERIEGSCKWPSDLGVSLAARFTIDVSVSRGVQARIASTQTSSSGADFLSRIDSGLGGRQAMALADPSISYLAMPCPSLLMAFQDSFSTCRQMPACKIRFLLELLPLVALGKIRNWFHRN